MNLKRLLSYERQKKPDPAERESALVETAVLDDQTRKFLSSNTGKYMIARMEQDQKKALAELAKVDHWDTGKIKSLQDQYQLACRIQNYIAEILNAGYQAKFELETPTNEEYING